MSIQSVGNNSSLWQFWQTMRKDFKTFCQDLTAFQTTQKSGTQDQIQTSQNVLQQAMTSLLNDITVGDIENRPKTDIDVEPFF